ncbi:hypothetical protein MHYP_G00250250 [Metynnis hypsauchen]
MWLTLKHLSKKDISRAEEETIKTLLHLPLAGWRELQLNHQMARILLAERQPLAGAPPKPPVQGGLDPPFPLHSLL